MIYRAKRKILKVAPAKRFHAMNFIKCKNADLPKAFEIGIFTNSIVPSSLQVHIYFYAPKQKECYSAHCLRNYFVESIILV